VSTGAVSVVSELMGLHDSGVTEVPEGTAGERRRRRIRAYGSERHLPANVVMCAKLQAMEYLDSLVKRGVLVKNHCSTDMDLVVLEATVAKHKAGTERRRRIDDMRADLLFLLRIPQVLDQLIFSGSLHLGGMVRHVSVALSMPEYDTMLHQLNARYGAKRDTNPKWRMWRLVLDAAVQSVSDHMQSKVSGVDLLGILTKLAKRFGILKWLGLDDDEEGTPPRATAVASTQGMRQPNLPAAAVDPLSSPVPNGARAPQDVHPAPPTRSTRSLF